MKAFFLLTVLFLIGSLAQGQDQKQSANKSLKVIEVEIILGIDKNYKLDFTPDPQIQVGDESIVTYTLIPQRREITLKGLKAGVTNVRIRNTIGEPKLEYKIRVSQTAQSDVIKKLKEFIGDIEGIEIGVKGGEVFVGGKIIVPSEIGRLTIFLQKFPDVLNLVELAPQAQVLIARKMQEEIQRQNLRDVTVRVLNGSFILEGVVNSNAARQKADSIAKLMLPANIQQLASFSNRFQTVSKSPIVNYISINQKKSTPPLPKLIKITTQFVELTKSYAKTFGFSWNPSLTDGGGSIQIGRTDSSGVTTRSSNSLTATIANLFPKLASAREAGFARLIQSGSIIVEENVAGKIRKSETVRFAQGSNEFTRAAEANAGLEVNVKASTLAQENVRLELGVEVSINTPSTPPVTLQNSITTTVTVKSTESAVIGGIVFDRTTTDYDKNPPFGGQEINNNNGNNNAAANTQVFSFLRSKNFTKEKSQFAIFITPEIIASASEGTDEIKRKFRRRGR